MIAGYCIDPTKLEVYDASIAGEGIRELTDWQYLVDLTPPSGQQVRDGFITSTNRLQVVTKRHEAAGRRPSVRINSIVLGPHTLLSSSNLG